MRHAPLCFALALVAGCAGAGNGEEPDGGPAVMTPAADDTPDDAPDGGVARTAADMLIPAIAVGGTARVTAGSLNLRSGPGTTNMVLTTMSCGEKVAVIGGPDAGWWSIKYANFAGWASGKYLVAEAAFDAAICAQPDLGLPGDLGPLTVDQASILGLAKSGVGYSYYWGHGSWRADGAQIGSCLGSCPNCSHTGQYGADCSGFVAKCWQIPAPSAITTDLHPYATFNFYNQTTHWSQVPRGSLKPADALVYNANGHGHIALVESTSDPWGSIWLYEARGCATGVVHNLRTVGIEYIGIRREGL